MGGMSDEATTVITCPKCGEKYEENAKRVLNEGCSITVTLDTYGHLFPRGDDSNSLAQAEAALLG
jgi:hypothetical protein